jgi:hypothetical protein
MSPESSADSGGGDLISMRSDRTASWLRPITYPDQDPITLMGAVLTTTSAITMIVCWLFVITLGWGGPDVSLCRDSVFSNPSGQFRLNRCHFRGQKGNSGLKLLVGGEDE